MLFSRKIFTKQIINIPSLFLAQKSAFLFAPTIKRKQLEELHKKLVT
jgi:hypothetical protein